MAGIVTADKVVNHDLYAKTTVSALDWTFKNIARTFSAGERIGNIYSYFVNDSGQLYWLIYLSKADYDNQNPIYVLQETGKLDVPDLPNILQKIADEQKAAAIEKNGVVGYYLETYLPYIVGAIVVAIALPSIVKSIKK
jgi:hypothetical protein